ncbi:UDP-N-acetylglucosamine acyltransferase [Achromatium sp. WMS2]|nr:UDP-N-acetylglucosamine acyltransferase [Achromatium sp. WMS2]
MAIIHHSAIIADTAIIHPTVQIGPYCIIDQDVAIGAGCVLDSNVRVYSETTLGTNNRICHGTTLGSEPQDLGFNTSKSKPLLIGNNNHFKENVNISRGIKTPTGTCIGDHNYFMTFSHVGHDCIIGNHNIFANTATLAGHVELADHVFVSGQVAIHQFCHIGSYVMIAGLTGVSKDVPPYLLVNGQRAKMVGLNTIGLRRNGFSAPQRQAIKQAYNILYRSRLPQTAALAQLRLHQDNPHIKTIIDFVEHSHRGLVAHILDSRT